MTKEKPVTKALTLMDGAGLLPVAQMDEALEEYDTRRKVFYTWLLGHMEQGIHYGFPPGTYQAKGDPKQWQSKPSLYKAGALLLCDLLRLRPAFAVDRDAWEQLGSRAGTFVLRCELSSRDTGEVLGEGRGIFAEGEKKMNCNSAIKMAQKRAMVDAVINTVAVVADLFTQDMEDNADADKPAKTQPAPAAAPGKGNGKAHDTKPAAPKQSSSQAILEAFKKQWAAATMADLEYAASSDPDYPAKNEAWEEPELKRLRAALLRLKKGESPQAVFGLEPGTVEEE